ncbi:MAG: hypothetical protein M3042_11750 [Actinomycetota bacterium]|nr:hypothetical protein [Actinomycetota bacterium]
MTVSTRCRAGAVAAAAVLLSAGLAGCSGRSGGAHASVTSTGRIGVARWAGSELHYGASARRIPGVVYQPGVVLIGGGANSVRSVSGDGLVWTIDASAAGARQLHVGSIMMATTLGTGRVLALRRDAGNVRVVLGPVALTDVIRDGTFASAAPLPLNDSLFYPVATPTAPASRDAQPSTSPSRFNGQSFANAALLTTPPVPVPPPPVPPVPAPALPPLPVPTGTPPTVPQGVWNSTPICCAGGVGVHIGMDNGAGRLSATVQLHLDRPTVSFRIRIGLGTLREASVQLHGAGGLSYQIKGATANQQGSVQSPPVDVVSVTIPLAPPLAITLTQSFDASWQIAGEGSLISNGDYNLSGELGFGYSGGAFHANSVGMGTHTSQLRNTLSLGAGVNSISLGWRMRATVGIGMGGFSAGAWVEFKAGMALTADQSPLSLRHGCDTESLEVTDKLGVGYSIPDYAATVINGVLGIFGADPIPKAGGPSWGPYVVWRPDRSDYCTKSG